MDPAEGPRAPASVALSESLFPPSPPLVEASPTTGREHIVMCFNLAQPLWDGFICFTRSFQQGFQSLDFEFKSSFCRRSSLNASV